MADERLQMLWKCCERVIVALQVEVECQSFQTQLANRWGISRLQRVAYLETVDEHEEKCLAHIDQRRLGRGAASSLAGAERSMPVHEM